MQETFFFLILQPAGILYKSRGRRYDWFGESSVQLCTAWQRANGKMSPILIDLFDCDSQTIRCLRKHLTGLIRCLCSLNIREHGLGRLTAVCIRAAFAVHRSLRLIQSRLDAFSAPSDAPLLAQLLCSPLHSHDSEHPNERAAPSDPFIHPPVVLGPPSIQPTHPDRSTRVVVTASSTTSSLSAAAAMFPGKLSDISGSTFRCHSGAVASGSPCSAQTRRSSNEGDEEPFHCGIWCWSYLSSSVMTFARSPSKF